MAYNLGYTYDSTLYGIRTRASAAIEKARYLAQIYSTEVTLAPADSFYLSLFYQRRNAETMTLANGEGGSSVLQPNYKANFDLLGFNYSYAFSKNTSFEGGYSMYRADNFDDFSTVGLPLGLDNFSQDIFIGFKRVISQGSTLELKYIYDRYREDSNNNIDDYEAHRIGVSMKMVF